MNQNKLITLFKTLSTKEVRQFGCFLKGASYRENSITFRLYKYLKKKHPSFPDKKISKTVLFEEIMPKDESANQRYSDKDKAKRVTDEMSILTKNLEKFLPILVLQHEEVKKDFLILSFLKQRKQDKLFFQKINQIQKNGKNHLLVGLIITITNTNCLKCIFTIPLPLFIVIPQLDLEI